MSEQSPKAARPQLLILEDDDLVGEGLALLARDAGFEPAIFKSLADANAAGTGTMVVSAIISDFDLGQGPNGVETAYALRANRSPQPPVLIVTASRQRHVEQAARAVGFEVSSKPASPAFLRRWLALNARVVSASCALP